MRRAHLAATIVLGACASKVPSTSGPSFIAIRPYNGSWQVLTLPCGTRIPTPSDEPYELLVLAQDKVQVLQAGPADDVVAFVYCRPSVRERPVRVIGTPSAAFYGFDQGAVAYSTGPTDVLLSAGPSDLVAYAPADGFPQQFLLEHAAHLSRDTLVLDFSVAGQPLVQTALEYPGLPSGAAANVVTQISTASGLDAEIGPSYPITNPSSIVTIPLSALGDGEREVVEAWMIDSSAGTSASTEIDLRRAADGPVPIEFVPPLSSLSITPDRDGVDVSVMASWPWNEVEVGEDSEDNRHLCWSLKKLPGWPDADVRFTGYTDIPGWDPLWDLPGPGTPMVDWGGKACNHEGATRKCAPSRRLTP